MKTAVLRRVRYGDRVVDLEAENSRLREAVGVLRYELEEVLGWATVERAKAWSERTGLPLMP